MHSPPTAIKTFTCLDQYTADSITLLSSQTVLLSPQGWPAADSHGATWAAGARNGDPQE